MTSVIQPWVSDLPLMQQTVLLTAVRGPDGVEKYSPVKNLLRWFRRCILLSAMDGKVLSNPWITNGGSFTGPSLPARHGNDADNYQPYLDAVDSWRDAMNQLVGEYIRELDRMPMHFHTHLMHAAQVLGYKHPNPEVADWWRVHVYERFVHHLHLWPETEEQMDMRLGDNRDNWMARNDKATLA